MILIKITKENRKPKVGEWYYNKLGYSGYSAIRADRYGAYVNCKTLSLSVILDAPETHGGFKNTHWIDDISLYEQYPISNSEEIFQWLHDNGKLGEEWVEWESYSIFDKKKGIVELPISPDQKTKPCPSWKECTAKEPRHCALNGCEKVREEEETWHDVFLNYPSTGFSKKVLSWLNENYEPPKRKEAT